MRQVAPGVYVDPMLVGPNLMLVQLPKVDADWLSELGHGDPALGVKRLWGYMELHRVAPADLPKNYFR